MRKRERQTDEPLLLFQQEMFTYNGFTYTHTQKPRRLQCSKKIKNLKGGKTKINKTKL